jgi:hypothetical protein
MKSLFFALILALWLKTGGPMMKQLLNKVLPKNNESLYSVFYRNARKNYADHLGSMLKHIASDIYLTNCNYSDEKLVKTPALNDFAKKANIDVLHHTLNKYNHLLVDSLHLSSAKATDFQSIVCTKNTPLNIALFALWKIIITDSIGTYLWLLCVKNTRQN